MYVNLLQDDPAHVEPGVSERIKCAMNNITECEEAANIIFDFENFLVCEVYKYDNLICKSYGSYCSVVLTINNHPGIGHTFITLSNILSHTSLIDILSITIKKLTVSSGDEISCTSCLLVCTFVMF